MVLVDDGDRRVVQFLRIASGLRDDGERERIDDEPQQNDVAHEAAQFLGAEPEDIAEALHRPLLAFLLAQQHKADRGEDGNEDGERQKIAAQIARVCSPLVKVPTLIGMK